MTEQFSGFKRTSRPAAEPGTRASMRFALGFLAWVCSAASLGACTRSSVEEQCGDAGRCKRVDGCVYDGERYEVGAQFPARDGCNTCSCEQGGQVACTERACVDACGGPKGTSCPDGEYCAYPLETMCGSGDKTGTCTDRPTSCDDVYAPVCGCDDQTYANACTAASAGVSVAHEGECGGPSCGGIAGIECPGLGECVDDPSDSCDPETGGADCGGICVCNSIADCGNGTVWDGSDDVCDCVPDDQSCGGLTGETCPRHQFCNYPPEAMCGAADQAGTCTFRPEACTEQYEPVCGCDDETYGNACKAAAAGVSVAAEGECS